MEVQEALCSTNDLQRTNAVWNACQVNLPWSVGYTSHLIDTKEFVCLDAWVTYYFDSGDRRDLLIDDLHDKQSRLMLLSITIPLRCSPTTARLGEDLQRLNLEYGRSWEAMEHRAYYFQKALQAQQIHFPLRVCYKIALQRVLIDTWNGKAREVNTIAIIRAMYPELNWMSSGAWEDFNYGIDYQMSKEGRLLGAIQIKPLSYRGASSYILKAQKANKKKFDQYTMDLGVPVFVVRSNQEGVIEDDGGLHDYLKPL